MRAVERMEGSFGGGWTCDLHQAQLTSFAAAYLNPPDLFWARRPGAEPILHAILRATDGCTRCRRKPGDVEDRQVGFTSGMPGEPAGDVVVRLQCTHRSGGPWECTYHADVKRKILLLGDATTRKTEIVRPAVNDMLSDDWRDSLGAKVMTRHETVELEDGSLGFHLVFTLWDIAGRRFGNKEQLAAYLRGGRDILAVCDLAQDRSVEELGYWLSVAERLLGKTNVVILAQGRRQPDPLPIAEARLREMSSKHRALVVAIPPGDSHRLEHIFRGIAEEAVREIFGMTWHPPMYV